MRGEASHRELFETLRIALAGRYRVSGLLGRGGMGAVFLADDLRLGRQVAVKVLRPELAEHDSSVGRFGREARIAARLDHPNIIPVYEVGQVENLHYFVMKYVRGRSLDDLLAGGALPVEQCRDILWQAACGLGHAHRRSVVHRDIKPSNIMLDEEGHAVITDFGISKALQADTQYTSTGQLVGTPRYVSPEQAQGLPLDGRSDQYSLAVVGYQALTGRLPLVADTVHALIYKHIYETPAPARAARAEIPPFLSQAIQRALAKRVEDRFPTMEEFATALRPERPVRLAGRTPPPDDAPPDARPEAATKAADQPPLEGGWQRVMAMGAGAAVLALVAVLTAGVIGLGRSAKPTEVGRVPESRPGAEVAATAPLRRATGLLSVTAEPGGAVSVDGVELGGTPIVRHRLPPGSHTVRIARAGFRTDTVRVSIAAGREVRLSRALVPSPR